MTTTQAPLSTSQLNSINGTSSSSTSTGSSGLTAQQQSDRFLKLLVAQMQNQDPLNPMDSAQVTSQMAQISTVEGVQTLNSSIGSLSSQFTQLQTMQGAALVGHTVSTEGNTLRQDAGGNGTGGFELASAATGVTVEIDDPSGNKIGTVDLGAQPAGRHDFSYAVPADWQGKNLTFKVSAVSGKQAVDTMSLTYNKITAVSTLNGQLALELDNGQRVAYDAVWSFQ